MSQKLADGLAKIQHHSISSLGECFAQFIPSKVLENSDVGSFSRRRVFSKTNTFWAFFSQVLDADGGCQEVVRKIQAMAASRSLPSPSAFTSGYCQARAKEEWLALSEQLTLRQIKVVVDNPGFRVQSFYIVTTLTDAQSKGSRSMRKATINGSFTRGHRRYYHFIKAGKKRTEMPQKTTEKLPVNDLAPTRHEGSTAPWRKTCKSSLT